MNTKDNSKDKEIKNLQRQLNKKDLEITKLRDSLKQAKKEAKASRKADGKKKLYRKH
jgi:predicted RNase H-like nuclease (RuvC/YqgF family)